MPERPAILVYTWPQAFLAEDSGPSCPPRNTSRTYTVGIEYCRIISERKGSLMSGQSNSDLGDHRKPNPIILKPGQGEKVLLGARQAPVEIKVSRRDGSTGLAAIMEHIRPDDGIPVHRHEDEDELFFIHSGEGVMALGEQEHPIEAGSFVFIPKGTWHGPRNSSASEDLVVVAVFSPSGPEGYFRELGVAPGQDGKALTEEEEIELERRYGIVYRGRNASDA